MKTKLFFIPLLLLSFVVAPLYAEDLPKPAVVKTTNTQTPKAKARVPKPPAINATAYVLMDEKTGKIIAKRDAHRRLPPASLTKLMTLYLISSALKNQQIALEDKVKISKKAWKVEGSRMFLEVNSRVSVKDLLRGIIVASGNDAAMAMAQYVGGTEARFVEMMNEKAADLGMKNTHYSDPIGLSDSDSSTPYDLAILARALIRDFPEDYKWYKEKWIKHNKIRQPNRNRLLWRDSSVDGLKTGHTTAAGFCLVASGKRHDMRLISVVMGAPSDAARINDSADLLNYGFRFYGTYKVYSANEPVKQVKVFLGKKKTISLGLFEALYITIPSSESDHLKSSIALNKQIKAPVQKGQSYGVLDVVLDGKIIATRPLVALENNPKAGFFARIIDHIKMWF